MNQPITSRKAPVMVLFALFAVFALSIVSYAQGRGNGKGTGPNVDKKCAKFVNCHDARDGRWDGRGPAINQGGVIPVWRPPVSNYPNGRVGTPNRDDQIYQRRSRNRRVNRSSDSDVNRDDNWRRRRRGDSDNTETRDRRVRRRDRTNVID